MRNDGVSGRDVKAGHESELRYWSEVDVNVELATKDPILGVTEAFLVDPSPSKVNVEVVSSLNFHS